MSTLSSSTSDTQSNESCGNETQTNATQSKRSQRGVTMMPQFTSVRNSSGEKILIEFDSFYRVVDCEHYSTFKSYVAFLGRSNVSILINDWKQVDENVKESIWTDVKVLHTIIFIYSISLPIISNTYLSIDLNVVEF